jgi:hypothetical protein
MTSVIVQLILALLLLLCAIGVQRSGGVPRSRTWVQIMGRIAPGHNHLAALSYGCVFSEGIECSSADLWANLGGIEGLVWIYKNTGVLLIAIDYIESSSPQSPGISGAMEALRRDAADVRFIALLAVARQLMRRVIGDSHALLRETAGSYFSFISHLGLAIHDYRPELLDDYAFPMSKV